MRCHMRCIHMHLICQEETLKNTHTWQSRNTHPSDGMHKNTTVVCGTSNFLTWKHIIPFFSLFNDRKRDREKGKRKRKGQSYKFFFTSNPYLELWQAPETFMEEADEFKWKVFIQFSTPRVIMAILHVVWEKAWRASGGTLCAESSHTALRWYSGGATS